MSTKERLVDRGRQTAQRDVDAAGRDIRSARIAMGMRMVELGRRTGLSASQVSRIERGRHPSVSVVQLSALGAVVGLDVRLRTYPGPDPTMGSAQNAVLARLVPMLDGRLRVLTEVGLPLAGDQRAWDATILGAVRDGVSVPLPVDIETRFHDPQAQVRRTLLKLRDSGLDAVLLVLADTRSNRDALRGAAALVRDTFPVSARRALGALRRGDHPGGSAIVLV